TVRERDRHDHDGVDAPDRDRRLPDLAPLHARREAHGDGGRGLRRGVQHFLGIGRPMARGEIELSKLTKQFAEVTAVDGINLQIPGGEFFSLLGPSGCGKTTTLRMIAGFEQPTSGQILLDGTDVAYTPPHRRNVNTVFQNYALFPHLNVYDNIAFGLRRAKR